MSRITLTKSIDAPLELVFRTIAHIEEFAEAVPEIVNVEFLSAERTGVGTKFRETRHIRKREASTILEVTEYEENEHVRIVSEVSGTIWDTIFRVRQQAGGTLLSMEMEARTDKVINKILNTLFGGIIKRAIAADLDAVKAFCERTK
ncbi:SRPBCC family protein [bacterium]|nr:SRPBCC family protein [bacterium]